MDEELGTVWLQCLDRLWRLSEPGIRGERHPKRVHTFCDLHVGGRLPLVHGHEPAILALPSTAQVYHQLLLVAPEGSQDCIEMDLTELAIRKQV